MPRKFLSILALFALLLAGCELHEPAEAVDLQEAKPGYCVPETRSFTLDYTRTGAHSYDVSLETGPFIIKECMCHVIQYDLTVTLNSASQWMLMLPNSIPVPFNGSAVGTHDLLTITAIDLIFGSVGDVSNGILKTHAHTTPQVPDPALDNAGGLCIIENYDGSRVGALPVGTQTNGPVIVIEPAPIPNTFVVKVFIPEEITDPV